MGFVRNAFNFLETLRRENTQTVKESINDEYTILAYATSFYYPLEWPKLALALLYKAIIVGTLMWYLVGFLATIVYGMEEFEVMSQAIHFSIILAVANAIQFTLIFGTRDLFRMHQWTGEGFYKYNEDTDHEYDQFEEERLIHRRMVMLVWPPYLCSVGLCAVVVAPVVDYLTGSLETGKEPLNGIPYNLPLPVVTPHDVSYLPYYMIAFGGQLLAASVVVTQIICADFLYIFNVRHVCKQLKILIHSLSIIDKRARVLFAKRYYNPDGYTDMYSNPLFVQCYEECLKKNIAHHQHILRFYIVLRKLVQYVLLMTYVSGGSMIALAAFSLMASEKYGIQIAAVLMCIGEVLNMGILCYFSQEIRNLNEDLTNAFYFINWYDCPSVKSLVLFAMAKSQQRMVMTAILADMDIEAFGGILNTAYSSINMLVAFM